MKKKIYESESDGKLTEVWCFYLRVTSTAADERNGLKVFFSQEKRLNFRSKRNGVIDCLLHTNIKMQNGQAEFQELHRIRNRTLLLN